jgi:hypothetical protein
MDKARRRILIGAASIAASAALPAAIDQGLKALEEQIVRASN